SRSASSALAGYGEQHVCKEKCGTRETRLRCPRRGKAARISHRRNRALRSGSPRGSLYRRGRREPSERTPRRTTRREGKTPAVVVSAERVSARAWPRTLGPT